MNQKELYSIYLKNCTNNSERSISNYLGGIKLCDTYVKRHIADFTTCFDVTSVKELDDIIAVLDNDEEFSENEKNQWHDMYHNALRWYRNYLNAKELFSSQMKEKNPKASQQESSHQIIYYGAPGTGKSNKIDELTNDDNRIRTTFHPDSDYSTFVGVYKPTMEWALRHDMMGHVVKDENTGKTLMERKITYSFVPQAFLKAYVEAWTRKNRGNDEPFYLVIEEINRGNCAQIFGDLFQLLDRDVDGQSKYAICPDDDIKRYLQEAFKDCEGIDKEIKSGDKMLLPSNLYIWATMNTSDQSLFPIDSAFKRRWDWEYMPIEDAGKGHVIEIGDKHYDWWNFISIVNEKIGKITSSEDKNWATGL